MTVLTDSQRAAVVDAACRADTLDGLLALQAVVARTVGELAEAAGPRAVRVFPRSFLKIVAGGDFPDEGDPEYESVDTTFDDDTRTHVFRTGDDGRFWSFSIGYNSWSGETWSDIDDQLRLVEVRPVSKGITVYK